MTQQIFTITGFIRDRQTQTGIAELEVEACYKDYTSQICPNCGTQTGKKNLGERVHSCSAYGYTTNRDVAAAQVVCQRGLVAVGQSVNQGASGGVLSGTFLNV